MKTVEINERSAKEMSNLILEAAKIFSQLNIEYEGHQKLVNDWKRLFREFEESWVK